MVSWVRFKLVDELECLFTMSLSNGLCMHHSLNGRF